MPRKPNRAPRLLLRANLHDKNNESDEAKNVFVHVMNLPAVKSLSF
jgi:hypothetical protein